MQINIGAYAVVNSETNLIGVQFLKPTAFYAIFPTREGARRFKKIWKCPNKTKIIKVRVGEMI